MAFFNLSPLVLGAILLATGYAPIGAESINPPTTPQASSRMTAQEKRNRDFVLDYYREVIQSRHMELASKYFGAYIQHNPNIPTGPSGIIGMFGQRPPVNPMPDKLNPSPVVSGAKGDFAWVVWEREEKDPRDPSKTYHYNFFDLFRFQNGKLEEHWDSAQKNPSSPASRAAQTFAAPSARLKGNRGKLSGDEKNNLDLATVKLKQVLQDGHLELADKLIDPDYLEHDPNVPQGRAGFMSQAGRKRQEHERKKSPPILTLVNGSYVLMMWDVKAKDPTNPSTDYTYNQFDLTRIEKGLLKEHWNDMRIDPAE